MIVVFSAGTEYVVNLYNQLMKDVDDNNFKLLEVLHHFTSGMKSVYTQDGVDGMAMMRQSIGGAGYSAWSSIPAMYDDLSPTVTLEGDNTVMAQQCFNYLQKQVGFVLKGKHEKVLPIFKYLESIKHLDQFKCKATKYEDWLDIN